MSMGGDFYALSDEQLQNMLNGELDYSEFLYDELDEKPAECFSKAEYCWNEIMKILIPENACGIDTTDVIPEMSGYSFSGDVKVVAAELDKLDEGKVRQRHAELGIEEEFETINGIVMGLVEFYRRAAKNGNAVLFRVT